jgi:type III pantothenate kinase
MNLVFDFGNTVQKMAVLSSGEVVDIVKKAKIETADIDLFLQKYNPVQAILSSVIGETATITDFLKKRIPLLIFSDKTPIPIQNEYKTPSTLGSDRLACAVAVASLFPRTQVLVLQMGTCITSDFVTELGIYKGGSISAGLKMRLQALHHFSAKLPLVDFKDYTILTGTTTEESILAGTIHAIEDECNGIIARYRSVYPQLKIILTGGDAKLFESKIKNEIFTIDHLVLVGLNFILNYNVKN